MENEWYSAKLFMKNEQTNYDVAAAAAAAIKFVTSTVFRYECAL